MMHFKYTNMFANFSLKKRKLELEAEVEIAQSESNETRNEVLKIKHQQDEVDKAISMLKEKLETENKASEKRRQLLSLLGPNSKENQEKVINAYNYRNHIIFRV